MRWLFSVFLFGFPFLPVEGACSLYSDHSVPYLLLLFQLFPVRGGSQTPFPTLGLKSSILACLWDISI